MRSLLLTAALLLCCLSCSAAWSGGVDTEWYGDGSARSYVISAPEELAGLAALVNAASDDFTDKSITLSGDIDLNGRQWTPIGNFGTTPVKAFEGTLDGGGNTIKNLTISGTGTSAALFGYIGVSGVVKNITVTGSIAGDYEYLAGVADINRGVIERCENRAAVTGTLIMESVGENSYCAGIAARNYGRISSCLNNARVEGGAAAGISCENGSNRYATDLYQAEKAVIEGCENSGEIIGKAGGRATAGGVAVTANSYTLKNCKNSGPVKGRGNSALGGIVAETDSRTGAKSSSIDGCVNSGSVTLEGDGSGSGVGGIVGGTGGITKILNCRNTGNVSGPNAPVGGIAGRLGGKAGTSISNCVNSGTITSSYIDNESYAGGIAAINFLLIEDCANLGDIRLPGSGVSQNWTAAGGVAGANRGSGGMIRRCASAGRVESFSTYRGGIAGYNKAHDPQDDEGIITECAWLDSSAPRAAGDAETTAGACPFTSEQQQKIV
ncbi:GLUG motif-containing protein, partial [Cloacibacillus evryensis]|uniref:GLUG motif-containing protein n=1 Tax=Cloacibacillus evryensis TaxID=508460 RepID=UPI0026E0A53A